MRPKVLMAGAIGVAAVVAVAVAAALYRPSDAAADGPPREGHMQHFDLAQSTAPRPDVSWADENGRRMSLADFDGKVVLFNYWASWCAPCQRELPGLDRLQAEMGGEDFTVIALNIDREGVARAKRNAERLGLDHLTLYLDPSASTARPLGLRVMPTTLLFDREGRYLGRLEGGAEWDLPEAKRLIGFFLDNPDYADRLPRAERIVVK